jgi:hypothetical protein
MLSWRIAEPRSNFSPTTEADALARELLQHEERAAALWRQLDVLSRLWLAGGQAGPPRFGRNVVLALQYPPHRPQTDLAPPAARAQAEQMAADWRARFQALLDEPAG